MNYRLKLVLGVGLFVLMLLNIIAGVFSNVWDMYNTSERGWEAQVRDGRAIVYKIAAVGPAAAALKVGDEVISLKGDPPDAFPLLYRNECMVKPGTGYTLTIRRGGQERTLELQTGENELRSWVFDNVLNLSGLIFWVTGLTVLLLKVSDKQAWLLALMLGAFLGLFQGGVRGVPGWLLIAAGLARLVGIGFFPLLLHFFLIFPDRSALLRRVPRFETWLYLPFLIVLFWSGLGRMSDLFNAEWLVIWAPGWVWNLANIFSVASVVCYLAGGLAALVVNYRMANSVSRRKLRVIMFGCVAGFLNLLLILLGEFFGVNRNNPQIFDWVYFGVVFTLPLIPISFAYAIIRHQVIPVSLIIRRSARYVLVSRGAILLDIIAVGLSVTAVLTYIFSRTRPPGIVIGLVSAAVGVITWKIASGLHDKYLSPLIDRRFFRQSYDAHQIIAELTRSLRTVTDLPQLLEMVATRIHTALQTVNVSIFLRDQKTGNFIIAYSRDYTEIDGRAISRERHSLLPYSARIMKKLSDNGEPFDVEQYVAMLQQESDNGMASVSQQESDNEQMSDHGQFSLPPNDARISPISPISPIKMTKDYMEALREVKATLLMPLASKDELLGLISLGPRLGDLPFSREDKQLLMSVSGPTTLAIENARLVERMVAEARRLQEMEVDHRRKTEELAFARQLQLSMLPARNISLDNLEIIGRMRTATEVGGDYYDFIEVADGRICVAVGDATGHGMAAGLVVGMVKMGLINGLQRMNGHASVKLLIEDLNRALKRTLSQRGMGMCLGAAILDTATLKAEVISNGMPAPYHYRAESRSLSLIATQAPPLGFLRQVNVRPVEMRLRPGDAFIWLSDGFEERLNQTNQTWGSKQVEQTLERICVEETSAENIASRMIEACDGAAGGRGNEDDMTIVVAKVSAG